jgi:hypothetical protein
VRYFSGNNKNRHRRRHERFNRQHTLDISVQRRNGNTLEDDWEGTRKSPTSSARQHPMKACQAVDHRVPPTPSEGQERNPWSLRKMGDCSAKLSYFIDGAGVYEFSCHFQVVHCNRTEGAPKDRNSVVFLSTEKSYVRN